MQIKEECPILETNKTSNDSSHISDTEFLILSTIYLLVLQFQFNPNFSFKSKTLNAVNNESESNHGSFT